MRACWGQPGACLGVWKYLRERRPSVLYSLLRSQQVPLVASNRIGKELMNTFYGGSFIAGPTGEIRAQVCCVVKQRACGALCHCTQMHCADAAVPGLRRSGRRPRAT